MRIKTVTILSLFVVFVIALAAVFINFSLVPAALSFAEENRQLENAISDYLIKMQLPINVLKNISSQYETSDEARTNVKLEEAFQRNAAILDQLSQQTARDLYHLKDSLIRMNEFSLNRHAVELQESAHVMDELMAAAMRISQQTTQSSQVAGVVIAIESNYVNMKQAFESIVASNKTINARVIQDMTMLLNFMFILLLIALSLFGTGVLWFIHVQLPFMMRSLNAINNHDYSQYSPQAAKPFFVEEKEIHSQIEAIIDENRFIDDVRELLLGTYLMDDAMEALYKLLKVPFAIDRIGIAFVDYDEQKIIAQYGVVGEGKVLLGPGFEIDIEGTTLKSFLTTGKATISHDLAAEFNERPNSPALKLLIKEGILSNMILPMTMGSAVFGFLFLSSRKANHFNDEMLHIAEKTVYEIKGLLNRAYFTKVIFTKITHSFAELVDQKDNETGDHIHRMVNYSTVLAKGLLAKPIDGYRVDQKFILELEHNASSHDIGKVGIPDNILKKPGKLTPDEWEIMKTHAAIGGNVFSDLRGGLKLFDPDFYRMAEEITRHHHEKWDGSGYPDGLEGDAIPLSARIVAVADVFDALTSKRVYKDAFDLEQSLRIIRESSGSHLDPVLVEVFFDNLDPILRIMNTNG